MHAITHQRYPQLRGAEALMERQQAPTRIPFRCDFAATKAATLDASGNLELVGYASTWVMDRDGEYIDPRAYDGSLDAYLAKNPMLLWQHNMDWPLGQVAEARVDGNGLMVRAIVRKPEDGEEPWKISAYNDIKAGIVRTFSVGGFFTRDFVAGRIVVTEIELLEISVVSIPSNPDSIFEAAQKALGKGSLRPDLPQKAISQMEQLLGLRAVTDPELVVLAQRGTAELDARYALLSDLYVKAGKLPPGRKAWEDAKQEPDARKRLDKVLQVMQAVQGRVDGKSGRVLSKANEGRLRGVMDTLATAVEQLQAVLAQVEQESAADDTTGGKGVHDYKGDGGPCKVCGEPPDHANHSA